MTDVRKLFAGAVPQAPEARISEGEFRKRLANLCLSSGLVGLPRKRRDRLILLQGVSMMLDADHRYTESEINVALESWLAEFGTAVDLDHVSLRRALVDDRFLERDAGGHSYRVTDKFRTGGIFAAGVLKVDVSASITAAREDLVRRRRQHGKNPRG